MYTYCGRLICRKFCREREHSPKTVYTCASHQVVKLTVLLLLYCCMQITQEMNLTSQSNFWPNVPVCEDDATFQSNCTVHLLNSSLHRLTQLYQSTLPTCTFCTSLSEDEQAEMNELYLFFSGDYLDQLLPFQCVSIILYCSVEH